MSAIVSTTTSGASTGDQSAGRWRGFASGSVGKAKAPTSGQTLLFVAVCLGFCGNAGDGIGMVLHVLGVTLQELLRKVRIVVMSILICG